MHLTDYDKGFMAAVSTGKSAESRKLSEALQMERRYYSLKAEIERDKGRIRTVERLAWFSMAIASAEALLILALVFERQGLLR